MSKRSGLFSGRTRHLARHHKPSQLSVRSIIKQFSIGDKVAIVPKGNFRDIPHPRYRGTIGTVLEKRGSAYVVEVKAINSKRTLIVPARHLEKASTQPKK
jgi:large subunit ribosomal protein L21e